MKAAFANIFRGYIYIGAIFAAIMETTYMWGIGWGAPSGMGFMDKFWAHAALEPMFILSAVIRMFLWLPSLVAWFFYPGDTSFVMWLAPGLFVQMVTPS